MGQLRFHVEIGRLDGDAVARGQEQSATSSGLIVLTSYSPTTPTNLIEFWSRLQGDLGFNKDGRKSEKIAICIDNIHDVLTNTMIGLLWLYFILAARDLTNSYM